LIFERLNFSFRYLLLASLLRSIMSKRLFTEMSADVPKAVLEYRSSDLQQLQQHIAKELAKYQVLLWLQQYYACASFTVGLLVREYHRVARI
jgi:hypothetical protein